MPTIVELECSGIPLLWVERPGDVMAALVFRTGIADEPLRLRGATHLIEHLVAEAAFADHLGHANAFVDLTQTVFTVEGPAALAADLITAAAQAVGDLPLDRLDVERRILTVEGDVESGAIEDAVATRYGMRGPGVTVFPEVALSTATLDEIAGWAAARLHRGNAVLCWVGPEQPQLELPLPPPPAALPPAWADPQPRPGLRLPAALAAGSGGIGFVAEFPRTPAAFVAQEVLERAFREQLRREEGLMYHVDVDHTVVGPNAKLFAIGGELPDHAADEARRRGFAIWQRLARDVDPDLVASAQSALSDALATAEATTGLLLGAALRRAEGEAIEQPASLREAVLAVTPAEVAAAIDDAIDRLLLISPSILRPFGDPFQEVEDEPNLQPVTGTTFSTAGWRRRRREELTIAEEGVTVRVPGDEPATVRWDEVVLWTRELSGAITLFGLRGDGLTISPRSFSDADALVAALLPNLDGVDQLPAHGADRVDEVQALAAEAIKKPADYEQHAHALATELLPGESLVALGVGIRGIRPGLVAVTDSRLLAITDLDGVEVEVLVLAAIRTATRKGEGLTLETPDGEWKFWGFDHGKRVRDSIADAIDQATA